MTTSVTTSATTSICNEITSPFIIDNSYNVFYAIPAFLIIVKPAFTKYLEETRINLTKYII